jgi:lipoprotein-releasing system ATP-binding protein
LPDPGATEGAESPLLQVTGLSKRFVHLGKEIKVLDSLDITVERGEMLAIVGASGVGKSTFLQVVGTLDFPTSGKVHYNGRDIFALPAAQIARFRNASIGFVFQFHHLLPEFTALENTMMPGLIQRVPRPEAEARAREILDEVGLSDRLTHKPGELSGGEQQRVALARALVLEPALILADEPTGNLDPATGEGIHELFFRLNRERGVTVVMVTHNQALAERMSRRYVMEAGRVRKLEPGEAAFGA